MAVSAYYELYLKSVIDLARSMVIKSEASARAVNYDIAQFGYAIDWNDPYSWKYYLNLAGIRHVSDDPMYIVSLDTRETIEFTVANLSRHTNTRNEYRQGSRYYNQLLTKYPYQEGLIDGVLRPVALDDAVEAPNHKILTYSNNLIESTEYGLLERIQSIIDRLFARWYVEGYELVDDLYAPTFEGAFFAFLPSIILNARLELCKTDFAHSFHIKEYLKSNGRLDPFYDYMTTKQRLWFYRNIRYVLRNAGKTETFSTLIERVMTDRGFPVEEYNLRHSYEHLVEDKRPLVEMTRRSINGVVTEVGKDIKSVRYVLDKQIPLAVGNQSEIPYAEKYVPAKMKNNLSNDIKTKVLESEILDYSESGIVSLADVMLNHWGYLAATGHYPTLVTVENPSTSEPIRVNARDGFILYLYAFNKARGFPLINLPVVPLQYVTRNPKPTWSELREMVEAHIVPDKFIEEAFHLSVDIEPLVSVDEFRAKSLEIFDAIRLQHDLAGFQHDWRERVQIRQMTDRFYMTYTADFGDGTPYKDWLRSKAIDIDDLNAKELETLSDSLLNAFTGSNMRDTRSIRDIHAAMIRIMEQLSSYSIHFIRGVNKSTLVYVDRARIRPGEIEHYAKHMKVIRLTPRVLLSRVSGGYHSVFLDAAENRCTGFESTAKAHITIDTSKHITTEVKSAQRDTVVKTRPARIIHPNLRDISQYDPNLSGYLPVTDITTVKDMFTSRSSDVLYGKFTKDELSILRGNLENSIVQ